ncbi:MAG: carboxylating nicotinate-nucleotide diphosphorylase [candidate division WOR-3 bacterium]|nr:carboxylating nicotinate-nucleotide diphosphorylase [candidate division WOR-3 bacterium]
MALKEDLGTGDITTDSIVPPDAQTLGIIFPKEDGVLCGVDIARIVFEEVDKNIKFEPKMEDGTEFNPGMTIATIIGPAGSCLKAERTALNFLQRLSGIATLTRKFVRQAGDRIKIMDTRKTTPGLRIMEKYAVKIGGGYNHRFGLYDMVLIKDNHIQIAGSITNAVNAVRKNLGDEKIFIEVEVKTMEELREAIDLKVERVMLDNMNPGQIAEAVKIIRNCGQKIEIEVSGGINLENISDYINLDIDYISIGALTHSAPAIDIALKMKPIG